MKKLFYFCILSFLLIGFALSSVFAEETIPVLKRDTAPALSKEEFSAALSSKFQLIKLRTAQLKAMNRCFLQASEKVLDAEKKGHPLTKTKALEIAQSFGLSEASNLESLLKDLQSDRFTQNRIEHLKELVQKKQRQEIDLEFQRLEKEIRADLEIAKARGFDISKFRKEMEEYARSRIESAMWAAIFTSPASQPKK